MKKEIIKIEKKCINELLEFVDGVTIPYYQRTYNWTSIEIERLIYDLLNNASDEYFCGNIVLYSKFQNLTIVDGQQRISTFLLFVKFIQDYLEEDEFYDVSSYKIDSQNLVDKKILQDLLNSKKEKWSEINYRHSDSNYVKNFQFLLKYFTDMSEKDKNIFIKRFKNIVLSLIVIGDEYDEYRLFTNINSTGLPLNAFDLVKNFMLSKMEINETNINDYLIKLDEVSNYLIDEKNKNKPLNEIVRLFISYKTGNVENSEATMLFRSFEEIFKKYYDNDEKRMIELFNDFYEFGIFYKFIKNDEIKKYYFYNPFRMIEVNFETFSSLVVFILKQCSEIVGSQIRIKDEKNIYDSFLVLEIYICSRAFLKKRSNDLTRFIPSVINRIKKENRKLSTAANLLDKLLMQKSEEINNISMPSKKDFYMALANSNIYDNSRKQLQALLIRINEYIDNNSKYNNVNIEHVMPQNINDWQIWDNFLISDEDYHHYLNTIGNLTIVSIKLNSEMSNKPFKQKKIDFLLKDSFVINNYFKLKNEWNIKEIKERSKKIIVEYLEDIYNINHLYEELNIEIETIDIDEIINYSSYFETSATKLNSNNHYSNLKTFQRKGMCLDYKKVCEVIYKYCVENKNLPEISKWLHKEDRSSVTTHGILNLIGIDTSKTSAFRNKSDEWYKNYIKENKDKIENLIANINNNL